MRTFAVLILILNVGYFIWQQVSPTEGDDVLIPGQSPFVSAEQSLVLLAELPPTPTSSIVQDTLTKSGQQEDTGSDQTLLPDRGQTENAQRRCNLVSGFDDENEAETFVTEIGKWGVAGKLEVRQEQVSSTWWVHLPPYESQSEAQSVIDELVAKGIDNFYMRTGELAGGISLGVFSREPSAIIAQSEFLNKGYKTVIKEIPRYVSKAYASIEAADPTLMKALEWEAFLATKTKLEVIEKLCETIAR